ncbi:MAG: ROK family sugar kinase or transcriptional regulator, partial [uncultured Friedmanniella sp.]
ERAGAGRRHRRDQDRRRAGRRAGRAGRVDGPPHAPLDGRRRRLRPGSGGCPCRARGPAGRRRTAAGGHRQRRPRRHPGGHHLPGQHRRLARLPGGRAGRRGRRGGDRGGPGHGAGGRRALLRPGRALVGSRPRRRHDGGAGGLDRCRRRRRDRQPAVRGHHRQRSAPRPHQRQRLGSALRLRLPRLHRDVRPRPGDGNRRAGARLGRRGRRGPGGRRPRGRPGRRCGDRDRHARAGRRHRHDGHRARRPDLRGGWRRVQGGRGDLRAAPAPPARVRGAGLRPRPRGPPRGPGERGPARRRRPRLHPGAL